MIAGGKTIIFKLYVMRYYSTSNRNRRMLLNPTIVSEIAFCRTSKSVFDSLRQILESCWSCRYTSSESNLIVLRRFLCMVVDRLKTNAKSQFIGSQKIVNRKCTLQERSPGILKALREETASICETSVCV